jgi:hypothetical protein
MPRTNHTLLIALTALVPAVFAGCASSSGAAKPSGPVPLDGARYKLIAAGGSLDGRIVEFKKRGDGFMGCLVDAGMKLRSAPGIDLGIWIFSLKPKKENEYEGAYRAIGSDGAPNEKEVFVSFEGDNLSWNLESATWERQSESGTLTPEQKAKCWSK